MGYSCCVPGCKSNYKKGVPNVTVFKFPSIGELRQKCLQNIPRKFDKITQSQFSLLFLITCPYHLRLTLLMAVKYADTVVLALWCGPRIASLHLPRYVVRGD